MRVDKTLSELWHLRGNREVVSFEELQEESSNTAFIAINTIKRLQEEIERLKAELAGMEGHKDQESDSKFEYMNRWYQLLEENKQLRKALEEIQRIYEYGQTDSLGEVMVEVEETCDSMYQIAEKAVKSFTNSK
jgi:cell division septum initiation protein DivIVA